MRTALVRRTVLTASAVSLALLATACGGDKPDTKKDDKASAGAPAPSTAPAAKGKTDAELTALLVTQAEAPGYLVQAEAAAKLGEVDKTTVSTDKPECKVLVQSQYLQKIGTPSGVARTALGAKPKEAGPNASPEEKAEAIKNAIGTTVTMVGLTSYDGKGAEELLASVKTAGQACGGGFTSTSEGETTKYASVQRGTGAPVTSGDDSASLVLTADLEDGDKATILLTVLRTGSTVATFSSLSLLGTAESPVTLVAAQSKKLG
ncbi:hypothetical protein [Streptomyces sp. NBC_01294]|uniref:hypothetical protein n=1 Tax=Streptomyces sp. NBC_01294 TaxID=2903815 RepID=UPI002DDB90EB|nr:hypothetical protein [Streptomyces sp. NBC_01294]WRZ57594.1 hypothetical protein OG534_14485 [Streptomyces sp. NBC_01294]